MCWSRTDFYSKRKGKSVIGKSKISIGKWQVMTANLFLVIWIN